MDYPLSTTQKTPVATILKPLVAMLKRSADHRFLAILLVGCLYHPLVQAALPAHVADYLNRPSITEGKILIRAPGIAENGAVVPISVQKLLIDGPDLHARKIWFFNDYRKTPMASYELSASTLATGLSARYRLAKTGNVHVVAQLSDGTFISGSKQIKVTIGGCGDGGSGVSGYSGDYHTAPIAPPARLPGGVPRNTERYQQFENNGVVTTRQQPLSTFSVDVDTGSYANVRRFILREGRLPVPDAVRTEELINYFHYDYPVPQDPQTPFSITTEIGPTPWNAHSHLLHVGLRGYDVDKRELPPANLVFLIDVSGSMRSPDKLGLLVASLKALARELRAQDTLSIVVYAGRTAVLLEPTPGDRKNVIMAALGQLSAGGSTNGGAGIRLAYDVARSAFRHGGINRVILATDGDFNVGIVNSNQLIDFVKQQRQSGISLTTLGFGTGNYNESLMEQLADNGDGNYAYIDNYQEARKVLIEQISGTLFTIAKDVKVQVEFNPAVVAEYRLIGYENRLLRTEDFRNDRVDAGDAGAGHTVTAIYEVNFANSKALRNPPLRYSNTPPATVRSVGNQNEVAMVQLRYKLPGNQTAREIRHIIQRRDVIGSLSRTSDDYRFSAAVSAFGQWLRGGELLNGLSPRDITRLAASASEADPRGYRQEFVRMVEAVDGLRQ